MMPRTIFLLLAFCAMLALVFSCSSGGDDNPAGNGGPAEAELDEAMAELDQVDDLYDRGMALAAEMDTADAIDSLAALLAADPDVDYANPISTGVNIKWKSGRLGFITLRLLSGDQAGELYGARPEFAGMIRPRDGALPPGKAGAGGYHTPKKKKTLFLSACYSEFRNEEDEVIDSAKVQFPRAGYEPFAVFKDTAVTVARLKSVASGDYGIIRLSSHGAPWPSEQDIQEVYFVTGEAPTRETFVANWEDIDKGDLAIGQTPYGKFYYINSLFFVKHNNFGENYPLVALSFCFGYRGYWPGDMMSHAKAGGVFGWDWSVVNPTEADYFREMMRAMCDTTKMLPTTLKTAHATGNTSYTETDGRVVSFHAMSVADSFGLWTPFRIDSLSPDRGAVNDTFAVHGVGFGAERGNGAVRLDDLTAGVLDWSETVIRATVPSGADGYMDVFVVKDGRETNKLPFVAGDDSLLALLHTRNRIEVVLNGDFRAGEEPFQRWDYLQPKMSGIEWTGTSFSIVYDTTWSPSGGTGTLVERFDGRVSPKGRKIETLTYTYDGDVDIPAGEYSQAVRYRYDCTITINNLDIEDVQYGMVHYSEAGPETGERVTISFRSENQGPTPGEPVSIHEYTHTNWDNLDDYPYLDVYFLE